MGISNNQTMPFVLFLSSFRALIARIVLFQKFPFLRNGIRTQSTRRLSSCEKKNIYRFYFFRGCVMAQIRHHLSAEHNFLAISLHLIQETDFSARCRTKLNKKRKIKVARKRINNIKRNYCLAQSTMGCKLQSQQANIQFCK